MYFPLGVLYPLSQKNLKWKDTILNVKIILIIKKFT